MEESEIIRKLRADGYIMISEDNRYEIRQFIDNFDYIPSDIQDILFQTEFKDQRVIDFLDGRSLRELPERDLIMILKDYNHGFLGSSERKYEGELKNLDGVILFGQKRVWDAKRSKFITVPL